MAEVQSKGLHLAAKTDLLRRGHGPRDRVGCHARLEQIDRAIHPLARLAVRIALRSARAPYVERAVITRAIAHERLDDIEERLISRTDQAIGEVMRMR